jgi:hypothetical protein
VNAMLISVKEMLRSVLSSVMICPVLLSARVISALHTGALYRISVEYVVALPASIFPIPLIGDR